MTLSSPRSVGARLRWGRPAFTLIEIMLVISIMAIMMVVGLRSFSAQMTHSRVNHAAQAVSGDLQLAMSEASSRRRPVRLQYDASTLTYTITDRASGTTYHQRPLGATSAYGLQSVSFSSSPVDFYPTGFASGALTVTLGIGDYARTVTMTRAGQVRLP
jgi:prepilin-type N-terminal cleavage/methylation domain-containing protein